MEEKVTRIEKEIEEQREERRKREEEYGGWDDWRGSEEVEPRAGQKRGVINRVSSWMSGGNDSEGFSDIERKRIWKLVMEKEKEEKRDNIVIKGLYVEERINNEWVENL